MALGEALGRLINPVPVAAGLLVSLKNAAGISFVCTGDDTFTVKWAATYNGTATALPAISRYYTQAGTGGAAAWTDSGDITAVSAVTIAAGTVVFYIGADDLPAGAEYVEVTVAASGLVAAITHDMAVQRSPGKLPALTGSGS